MKRISTFIAAICLCVSPLLAQEIFNASFQNEDEFKAWTVVDGNDDGKTWQYDSSTSPSVFYSYHSTNSANDWLISPAITSTQSGTIAVSFTVKGSSYGEKMEVFSGNAATVEAMTSRICDTLALNDSETTHLYLMSVTANEPIYLGLHACSDPDKWRLYLSNVSVKFTTNPVDLSVTEISAPVSGLGLSQETVTVKVKNEGNTAVESFDLSFAIDDSTIATEKINQALAIGAEMEYTFTAKADLSQPRKNFNIKAWVTHADDINASNDATSISVLHKAPASVPYFMGFEASEYTDGITFFNLNEDDGTWDIYTDPWWSLSHTGDYCLAYNYNRDNNANDWTILEPIAIAEAGYYVLKFWYSGDDTHPEKLGVYYGNECNPSAMSNKIVEYAPFARSAYEESINIIYIDKPQTIYIGFYAFSDKDENWLCVDDVSFEKIESDNVDLAVTEITNPGEFYHKGSKKTIGFKVRNYGITNVDATIRVKVDDEVVSETNTTILAQEISSQSLLDVLASLSEGEHKIAIEVVAADDKVQENNIDSLKFRVMGTPVQAWDFEDGKLPEGFVFRVEDDGTVNPSAGSEFNEEGWGIFKIQKHEQFGEYMLAGTSWLDGTDKADRWCVLPPFCPTESSFLVWDVASFNPNYLETYSVMISSNGDDSWYYFTEEEYHLESPEFKTRGLDLSSYASDTIYIAFRLRSKNCEHLILDNIELYGGELDGVDAVEANDVLVKISANAIEVVGTEVKEIAICDMNGRNVAATNANVISTQELATGVYIVRITTADGTITKKIVKK